MIFIIFSPRDLSAVGKDKCILYVGVGVRTPHFSTLKKVWVSAARLPDKKKLHIMFFFFYSFNTFVFIIFNHIDRLFFTLSMK